MHVIFMCGDKNIRYLMLYYLPALYTNRYPISPVTRNIVVVLKRMLHVYFSMKQKKRIQELRKVVFHPTLHYMPEVVLGKTKKHSLLSFSFYLQNIFLEAHIMNTFSKLFFVFYFSFHVMFYVILLPYIYQ